MCQVRRRAKRRARYLRRATRRLLWRVGRIIARAVRLHFCSASPTAALVVLLVDPMPQLVQLASAILREVAPPSRSDW